MLSLILLMNLRDRFKDVIFPLKPFLKFEISFFSPGDAIKFSKDSSETTRKSLKKG